MSDRTLLLIEQDELLPGTGLVGRVAEARGVPVTVVRAWEGELAALRPDDYAGIVPLGGKQHAWDEDGHPYLGEEKRLLQAAVAADVPVLGICLGGQVLARALGAEVRAAEQPERGFHDVQFDAGAADDPVLGPAASVPTRFYQWHVDVFDAPAGATVLATSPAARVQAFRLGRAWGLQFHPEVDRPTLELWLANHPDACEEAGVDEKALRGELVEREPTALEATAAARLIGGFLDVVSGR